MQTQFTSLCNILVSIRHGILPSLRGIESLNRHWVSTETEGTAEHTTGDDPTNV